MTSARLSGRTENELDARFDVGCEAKCTWFQDLDRSTLPVDCRAGRSAPRGWDVDVEGEAAAGHPVGETVEVQAVALLLGRFSDDFYGRVATGRW